MFGNSISRLMPRGKRSVRNSRFGRAQGEGFCLFLYREHEKISRGDMADIKNVSDACPAITSRLFYPALCKGKAWIHLDIAERRCG